MSSEEAPPPKGDAPASDASTPESSSNSPSAPPPPPKRQQEEKGGKQQVISQVVEAPPPPPVYGRAALAPPPPPRKAARKSPSTGGSKSGLGDIDQRVLIGVAAAAGLLVLFLIALVCCCCCRRRRKNKKYGGGEGPMHYYYVNGGPNGVGYYANAPSQKEWITSDQAFHMPPNHSSDMSSHSSTPPLQAAPPQAGLGGLSQGTFSYEDLAAATSGFSQANLLGQGGFGYVHKGVLPNGREIAVKSLKSGSGQGEREFQAEVEIISRVHHRHLVSLLGYCIAGGHRMLVYEYVPNNNLEFHLHGKGRPPMGWGMRLKVAKGAARGLAYLHEDCHPRIIHRDIKTANVLIDYNFDAQVADFGLAKLSSDNTTHVSTRIMGTFGYLAPEYACSGKLTEKSDVYSFGIMLLELITGRPPIDFTGEMEESLVDWARPLLLRALEDGNCDEFVDPRLEKNFDPQEMRRMVASAASAVRQSAKKRPKMSQIVRALEGDVSLDDLHDGVKPGQSTIYTRSGSNGGDAASYSAEMRRFRKMVLDESQECTSSEYEPDRALSAKLK